MPEASADSQSPSGPDAGQCVDDVLQSADVLGEPAGQFDAVAADVVQRQGGVDPGVRIVGHRHPGQHPVETETPSVVHEVDAERLAVLLVESPPDVGLPHPAGDALQIVVGETEPGPHRSGLGQVEHLAGGDPAAGEGKQLRGHPEQRVGLDQRPVGQAHPQLMGGVGARHDVTETEVGDDQRRVGLDVRAHHQDVARFESRIVGE